MPIYEYRCQDCRHRVTIFVRSFSEAKDMEPQCPYCEGTNLNRLVSRVAVMKSEESRMESLADPSMLADLDENDPKSIGRMMRKMSNEMGTEDLPPEFDEVVGRLESGESPEAIEKSMPELGESLGGPEL